MPVFCFHASEGRGFSAASDSPLSVPMLAGLAAPVGQLMLAVSDVLVEAAEQLLTIYVLIWIILDHCPAGKSNYDPILVSWQGQPYSDLKFPGMS